MESSSCKRAKAPGNISQVAHCLVDGCDADLRLCRDYHRRHKVCETHSKTPKVSIAGREQRFCQQCSRFHSLVEFDEGKRSCRKRLDGHNRRRRKPQPDSLSRNPGSLVFSSQQGSARLLSFSRPQIPPTSVVSSSWAPAPVMLKSEENMALYKNDISTSRLVGSSSGFNQDRALSLLSSGPASFDHLQQQYASAALRGHCPPNFGDDDQASKVVVSAGAGTDASTLHFPQMLGQSSTSGSPHQTLSFMWE